MRNRIEMTVTNRMRRGNDPKGKWFEIIEKQVTNKGTLSKIGMKNLNLESGQTMEKAFE